MPFGRVDVDAKDGLRRKPDGVRGDARESRGGDVDLADRVVHRGGDDGLASRDDADGRVGVTGADDGRGDAGVRPGADAAVVGTGDERRGGRVARESRHAALVPLYAISRASRLETHVDDRGRLAAAARVEDIEVARGRQADDRLARKGVADLLVEQRRRRRREAPRPTRSAPSRA